MAEGKAWLAAAIGILMVGGFVGSYVVPEVSTRVYLPAALLRLWFVGRQAVAGARAGSPFSIEMLMSTAVVGAVLIGATSEAATVTLLFAVGELLKGFSGSRACAGIAALGALVPWTAMLIEGETTREVRAASLKVGDLVLVRPGDRIPSDGDVVGGGSEIGESPATSEFISFPKIEGVLVFTGNLNASSTLQVRIGRPASDNTIARLVRLTASLTSLDPACTLAS